MLTCLALLLTETAAQHPDRPAVRHDDRVLTYAALDEASAVSPLCSALVASPSKAR